MKISVLGAGRWASCIAYCMDQKNYNVKMWEKKFDKENPLFLSGKNQFVELSKNVTYTHNLVEAVKFGEVIFMSILSQKVDEFMQEIKQIEGYQKKLYVLAMKGVEASTGRRLSEILIDNGVEKDNIAVFVGPGHVQSIYAGQPTNMTVSAYRERLARVLQKLIGRKNKLDVAYSEDIIGTEIGAAAKNVIGIAAGILEGCGYEQKKGALMPAAVNEIGKFIDAMGGEPKSSYGLAFLGDFQATLFDHNSKNLTYGKLVAENKTVDKAVLNQFINVDSVEGIMTSYALIKKRDEFNARTSEQNELKMPITQAVADICSGKVPLENVGDYLSEKITEAIDL